MIIADILKELSEQGIMLWGEDGRLKYRCKRGALTPTQRILLQQHKTEILAALKIPRVAPLAFAQQRLWIIYQMNPDNPTYNEAVGYNISGDLNLKCLEQALNEIIRRHETLRTTFSMQDNQPVQLIHTYRPVPLTLSDFRHSSSDDRNRHIEQQIKTPFDLVNNPGIRISLLQTEESGYILLVVFHHIITDGWSMACFYEELTGAYQALVTDSSPSLPELPRQYAEFAKWQHDWLEDEHFDAQLGYWKRKLSGELPVIDLATDRPAKQTFRGAKYFKTYPSALLDDLKALSRQEKCTLFTVLMAAFKVFIYRYTHQTDILIGIPVAGRTQLEIEPLIGFFVNTLPIRSDLSNNPEFRTLLRQVKDTLSEAQTYQDVPFDRLVEVIQPERDSSRSPLVQIVFSQHNTIQPAADLPGIRIQPFELDEGSAKFDLFMLVSETDAGLQVRIEYNTDLFVASTIERMAGHYQVLLEGIVANPDEHIGYLPLLNEGELQQILITWNDLQPEHPGHPCIHGLFEEQAVLNPGATALIFDGVEMTYQTLNQQANQLAHYLHSLGVQPGALIALSMERSFEMIAGMLAILKAGGCYVPLDPTYPQHRLEFMLADTGASILLTRASFLSQLPSFQGQTVCLDADRSIINQYPTTNPDVDRSGEDLAYIMYTSGSSGQPKGVCVTHKNVRHLVKNTDYADLSEGQTFLQFAPVSFDASTFEIWGALLNGSRLVIFPARLSSLEDLGHIIEQYQVSTLWLTSELFHQMVDNHLDRLKGVRQLLAGGDVLSPSHVQKAITGLPDTRLINGYGPTENTTFTTTYPMYPDTEIGSSVPIGRPITNTTIYILDPQLQPVPVGVVGELYTGGDGVAQGYLNLPELTRERFIPDPFSQVPGTRLYKTGDLARYQPDGVIEYIGRADNQVKIRGYRIELDEIETVLTQHADVARCVVLIQYNQLGDKHLVAYIVRNRSPQIDQMQEDTVSLGHLGQFLRRHLPEYMVPNTFVDVEDLPTTPNGKIDRNALQQWGMPVSVNDQNDVDLETPLEEMLAEIWQDVLKIESVGRTSNFFELGGHSLLALQIVRYLQEAFDIEVPLHTLFDHPTIASLAPIVESFLLNEAE